MKSKLGTLFIALGVLALLGAACLFGYNQWDNARAEKAADAVLNQLEETLEQPKTILPGESEAASDTAEEPAEEVPAEAPAEEAPAEEPAAEVAANEPVAEEADFAE